MAMALVASVISVVIASMAAGADSASLREAPFLPAAADAAQGLITMAAASRRLLQSDTCAATCQAAPVKYNVCGVDGKTYDYCVADCKKVKIRYWGACKPNACLCSFGRASFWQPVCGGGKSYINACFAKCSGVSSTKDGFCSSSCKCGGLPKVPVCGLDGKTYDNQCKAYCAGTQPYYSGACDKRISTCACSSANDPVCVKSVIVTEVPGLGTIRTPTNYTYGNPCLAKCEGKATTWSKGACPVDDIVYEYSQFNCGCSFEIKPVCAQSPIIKRNVTLTNSCTAKCVGYKVLYDGTCKNECLCPPDPLDGSGAVCVGGSKPYKSACEARCAGATQWTAGKCAQCSKPCPLPTSGDDLVCGADGIPYPTTCYAVCAGTTVAYKGLCKGLGRK